MFYLFRLVPVGSLELAQDFLLVVSNANVMGTRRHVIQKLGSVRLVLLCGLSTE